MSILIFILKIIGILLLVLLFLVLFFLFHPIFYRLEGKANESISVRGYFWWLFQILRLEFYTENGEIQWRFRVFCFSIKSDAKKEDEEADFAEPGMNPADLSGQSETGQEEEKSKSDVSSELKPEQSITYERMEPKEKPCRQNKRVRKKKDSPEVSRKKNKTGWTQRVQNLKEELTDPKNRQAVSHLWKELRYLLSHLKPGYLKAELFFATGDPAVTGKVTGALSLMPIVYRYDVQICPDFLAEEFYVKGTFRMKGHVALYHFFRSLIRLICDRNLRSLYDKFRK